MKKVSKIMLASSIVLSVASTSTILTSQAYAQEFETPYYNYTGYTSYQSNFLLDEYFKNALASGNVNFNGIKVNQMYNHGNTNVKLYDQNFTHVHDKKASSVEFPVQSNTISLTQIKEIYGNDYNYQPPLTQEKREETQGLYGYKIGKGNIVFYVSNGYVQSVTIS
ncbi:hypothetical protein DOS70_04725 [Staphylococcus felis]|uniref:Immunodominant staphylococcal antigen B n=1 Tax=Staphylococcus felis TaxID=46127 RepID=A0A3E0IKA1_9STAP|nr:hypothetical protein [Staphylococcus felis]REH77207.1 hypothetical protein DOS57_06925 [Staphylococcus felis]REH83911.1 hypothetical protein DOS61_06735 [Staphylococcus felis]REH88107.1 hypothetical protein DOS83_14515 [Staphylococcus felis]REH96324.1 hypothetical protein DOS70_04725 [Staphylococcus felis]REH98466.1 hypothetical protein DOS67_01150 [Staphylococcus felis]